jgi:hypothetical protein
LQPAEGALNFRYNLDGIPISLTNPVKRISMENGIQNEGNLDNDDVAILNLLRKTENDSDTCLGTEQMQEKRLKEGAPRSSNIRI